jgi:arginine:ornithine antiporter/lysine permease
MKPASGLSLTALSCLVVGSMVGGGIFSLPQAFGEATGILGALIAWGIAGAGMLAMAFVFLTLSRRRPDIDAGIYGYARDGFGEYVGFLALIGYWASACLGNVTFLVLSQSVLGTFFPIFGAGSTPAAVICASAILWLFHFMLLRGVKQASAINVAVTVAKMVPLAIFLVIVIVSLHPAMLKANIFAEEGRSAVKLFGEVQRTMLVVVFVFLGIEGASVYSRLARNREDVGRATLIGFLAVLTMLILVSVLPYGILPRVQLASLHNPSVAGVLSSLVGVSGHLLISLGVLISVLGAFLAWSLLAAEVLFAAGKQGIVAAFFSRENRAGAPAAAIWSTTIFAQIFLVLLTSLTASAFRFAIELTSCVALIPYFLVACYSVKLALSERAAGNTVPWQEYLQSFVATLYTFAIVIIGGGQFLLFACLFFAFMTVFFIAARRERGERVFKTGEWALAGAVVILACLAAAKLVSQATAG